MSPIMKVVTGLVISIVYVGLNWILIALGGSFTFAAALTFGPQSLIIGFAISIVLALVLLIIYFLAIRKLIRTKKELPQSHVVHPTIRPGQVYRHYKGNHYKVLVLGKHSETGEELVAYQREEDGHVFFRPIDLFFLDVEWEGKTVPRFTYIRG